MNPTKTKAKYAFVTSDHRLWIGERAESAKAAKPEALAGQYESFQAARALALRLGVEPNRIHACY